MWQGELSGVTKSGWSDAGEQAPRQVVVCASPRSPTFLASYLSPEGGGASFVTRIVHRISECNCVWMVRPGG